MFAVIVRPEHKCQFHQCILEIVFSWVHKRQIILKLQYTNMNLFVIGIGISHEKDLIIGYRYWLKCLISCIPKIKYWVRLGVDVGRG